MRQRHRIRYSVLDKRRPQNTIPVSRTKNRRKQRLKKGDFILQGHWCDECEVGSTPRLDMKTDSVTALAGFLREAYVKTNLSQMLPLNVFQRYVQPSQLNWFPLDTSKRVETPVRFVGNRADLFLIDDVFVSTATERIHSHENIFHFTKFLSSIVQALEEFPTCRHCGFPCLEHGDEKKGRAVAAAVRATGINSTHIKIPLTSAGRGYRVHLAWLDAMTNELDRQLSGWEDPVSVRFQLLEL